MTLRIGQMKEIIPTSSLDRLVDRSANRMLRAFVLPSWLCHGRSSHTLTVLHFPAASWNTHSHVFLYFHHGIAEIMPCSLNFLSLVWALSFSVPCITLNILAVLCRLVKIKASFCLTSRIHTSLLKMCNYCDGQITLACANE